ncbi:MAG: SCO1664 family protein [Acidimicrobiia bacterium]
MSEPGHELRIPVADLALDGAVDFLRDAELEVLARMPYSSNATFIAVARTEAIETAVIYKPMRGERPLWDFPDGTLFQREVATHELSAALGWGVVPPTVERDGPFGLGMVQLFVEHDADEHYFTLLERFADRFRALAAFDVLANNADRKGGHCLHDVRRNDVIGIDHGLTFHEEWKLRTVIWDFAGEPIAETLLADIDRVRGELDGALGAAFEHRLSRGELDALRDRADELLAAGSYPIPEGDWRSVPYPLV